MPSPNDHETPSTAFWHVTRMFGRAARQFRIFLVRTEVLGVDHGKVSQIKRLVVVRVRQIRNQQAAAVGSVRADTRTEYQAERSESTKNSSAPGTEVYSAEWLSLSN